MTQSSWALVTGATSGIGLGCAKALAKRNYNLVIVGRNVSELRHVAELLGKEYGVNIHTLSVNLSQPDSAQTVWEDTVKHDISIEILVNNAGVGAYGEFYQSDWNTTHEMMNLNMLTLTYLTRLFLPPMIARRNGYILHVASTAAFLPGPLMAVYYATKAFVMRFSDSIRNELIGTGVSVSVVCPGPTATKFQSRSHISESKLFKRHMPSGEEVAEIAINGMLRKQSRIVPGLENKITAVMGQVLPHEFAARLVRFVQERDEKKSKKRS